MEKTSEAFRQFNMILDANKNACIYDSYEKAIIQLYEIAYKEGFEAGKENQREAMQEGKVTYARIT